MCVGNPPPRAPAMFAISPSCGGRLVGGRTICLVIRKSKECLNYANVCFAECLFVWENALLEI